MPVIVKGDGSRETFDQSKLERSLKHAGAPGDLAARIGSRIAHAVRDGMTTSDIYRDAFALLHREERVSAARYSMRRAILDLGPTGFPFEDYVGALMRARGYNVQTRVSIQGKCALHEVDVVMEQGGRVTGAELKFHNTPGFKTDLKTALYVKARFDDIGSAVTEGMLITNTKFTENAISYAACAGVTLLGWNHPQGAGLADIIQETRVYPITVLTDLSKAEKTRLLAGGVPLCKDITDDPTILDRAGIPRLKRDRVLEQSIALCTVPYDTR